MQRSTVQDKLQECITKCRTQYQCSGASCPDSSSRQVPPPPTPLPTPGRSSRDFTNYSRASSPPPLYEEPRPRDSSRNPFTSGFKSTPPQAISQTTLAQRQGTDFSQDSPRPRASSPFSQDSSRPMTTSSRNSGFTSSSRSPLRPQNNGSNVRDEAQDYFTAKDLQAEERKRDYQRLSRDTSRLHEDRNRVFRDTQRVERESDRRSPSPPFPPAPAMSQALPRDSPRMRQQNSGQFASQRVSRESSQFASQRVSRESSQFAPQRVSRESSQFAPQRVSREPVERSPSPPFVPSPAMSQALSRDSPQMRQQSNAFSTDLTDPSSSRMPNTYVNRQRRGLESFSTQRTSPQEEDLSPAQSTGQRFRARRGSPLRNDSGDSFTHTNSDLLPPERAVPYASPSRSRPGSDDMSIKERLLILINKTKEQINNPTVSGDPIYSLDQMLVLVHQM